MINEVIHAEEKYQITYDVLTSLPEWFGIPESILEYARNSKHYPMYAYYVDNQAVGFIILKKTSTYAVEVNVMGIKEEYHRQGIGRKLIEMAEEYCLNNNIKLLHVKTVDPIAQYQSYLQTYQFYLSQGFIPLEVLPLWDDTNPCLLLVKPLN